MRKLLKEPLIHFLGGALLVFGFFWATGADRDPADYAITVDQRDIARLKSKWVQNFHREPTEDELNGLIDQEISEEIYYREALRLGLDRGDTVIKRRLFTKMRFLNNEEAADDKPTDAVLNKWLDDHPDKYALSSLYDIEQIYLGQIGAVDSGSIIQTIGRLNSGAVTAASIARPISLPSELSGVDTSELRRRFGEKFAPGLAELETGKWQGPVTSGFGLHLVKITAKVPGKVADLDAVRQRVTNDWQAAQNTAREKATLEKYRSQYDIKVAGRE